MKPSDKFAPSGLSEQDRQEIEFEEQLDMALDAQELAKRVRPTQAVGYFIVLPPLSARRRFGIDWD